MRPLVTATLFFLLGTLVYLHWSEGPVRVHWTTVVTHGFFLLGLCAAAWLGRLHWKKRRLGKGGLLVGLIALTALWTGAIKAKIVPTSRIYPESGVPFICPKREGVCLWSEKTGWRKILDTPSDAIVEFSQSDTNRLVILVRGYGDPGQIIVAGRDGRVQVVKNNAVEGNLARVTGADAQGNIVLCSDTPEDARCDTFLPRQGGYAAAPWFPAGCLFPRFLSNGSRACLLVLPEPMLLLISGDHETQRVKLPAEISTPSDFQSLSPIRFIFLAGSTLYCFTLGTGLEVIARDEALWAEQVKGTIQFGFFQERDGGSISRYLSGVGAKKIWRSAKLVPTMVQRGRDGLFIDAWGDGLRQILYLPSDTRRKERIVWREESKALWK